MRLEVMFLIVRVLCYDLGCSRAPHISCWGEGQACTGRKVRCAQPVNMYLLSRLSFNEFCLGNEYEAAQRRQTKDASNIHPEYKIKIQSKQDQTRNMKAINIQRSMQLGLGKPFYFQRLCKLLSENII